MPDTARDILSFASGDAPTRVRHKAERYYVTPTKHVGREYLEVVKYHGFTAKEARLFGDPFLKRLFEGETTRAKLLQDESETERGRTPTGCAPAVVARLSTRGVPSGTEDTSARARGFAIPKVELPPVVRTRISGDEVMRRARKILLEAEAARDRTAEEEARSELGTE